MHASQYAEGYALQCFHNFVKGNRYNVKFSKSVAIVMYKSRAVLVVSGNERLWAFIRSRAISRNASEHGGSGSSTCSRTEVMS